MRWSAFCACVVAVILGGLGRGAEPKSEAKRATVVVTIPGPILGNIALINHTNFGKDWDKADGPLAAEIKRMNRQGDKLPAIRGSLNLYWFGLGDRGAGVQVGFMETDTDRLPGDVALAFQFLFTKPGKKAEKRPESLVCEGALVKGLRIGEKGATGILAARCATMRLVGKDAKVDVPKPGEVWVTGKAVAGKFEYEKGKEAALAVENGDQPIILAGEGAAKFKEKDKVVRVRGTLQVGQTRTAPLYVEATSIRLVEEK